MAAPVWAAFFCFLLNYSESEMVNMQNFLGAKGCMVIGDSAFSEICGG
jgi:hypothetical protein